jgi:beta-lactamase class A
MKKTLTFLSFAWLLFSATAQKTDKKLASQLNELLKGFNGDVGIYVHDLKKNRIVAINADTVFPTASMVKVPILTGIMRKIEDGELQYHQVLTYKDSLLYAGVDLLGSFKNNEKSRIEQGNDAHVDHERQHREPLAAITRRHRHTHQPING